MDYVLANISKHSFGWKIISTNYEDKPKEKITFHRRAEISNGKRKTYIVFTTVKKNFYFSSLLALQHTRSLILKNLSPEWALNRLLVADSAPVTGVLAYTHPVLSF